MKSSEDDRISAGMRRWRREFPDIDCSGKAVVGRMLHLQEVFLREVNRTLAKHRLNYPAFALLATLRVEGAPYRMSPKALLGTLILTSGGLSNILRKLEKAGHIRRLANETDGRGVIVELTEQGRRLVEPAMRDHAETEKKLVAALSPEEQRLMAQALKLLMHAHSDRRAGKRASSRAVQY
ncbi:MAG TPA: MarR family transcriptional regulator [Pusillimonas sp.]|mgnify:CR=1 FL=1|uniref:MarR family winged helix-turn-helix transcriptional regulator n=1 Tax=Pusillimonas sp. TaxID=3040095 RepID=UPI002B4B47F5|nr:MarR family transcriptional regulator [Pusillimonas sp.]HLU18398.1 MarR family transcriptional regulator [Pusillimonas sp.]